jgi:hypothetical protein
MDDLKRWDRIEVYWEDSYQMHGWVLLSDSEYKEDISLGHQSMGYFIGQTPKQITLCQSKKSSKLLDIHEDTNVNAVFSIPKSCIKKVRKV